MTGADIKAALEFHRRTPQDRLREYHLEGLCRLDAIPDDAVLVTQESLARALHDAGVRCSPNIPFCRATHSGHAARILAALAREEASRG